MYVKQQLSILFYRSGKKQTKDGQAPIYVRITIDGEPDEFSSGIKVSQKQWEAYKDAPGASQPDIQKLGKQLRQIETDLERHFDLLQAREEIATPQEVIKSYRRPLRGEAIRQQKLANLALSDKIHNLSCRYLDYYQRHYRAYLDAAPHPERALQLQHEQARLKQEIKDLSKEAQAIFDDKHWSKTLGLALDEHLLHFLQLCGSGERRPTTLEKMYGRKRKIMQFLADRYHKLHMPLSELKGNFLEQLEIYLITEHHVRTNTVAKYHEDAKAVMRRCVANGWIGGDIFGAHRTKYVKTERDSLTEAEFLRIMQMNFDAPELNEARDIFVFCSFTGLAYVDLRRLGPEHLINGQDGKPWISINRQKTSGNETVPLLPIPLGLIDKYHHHPTCLRRHKLFPVPSCEQYNRLLKDIASQAKVKLKLRTHDGRYYFSNEVLYANGVRTLREIADFLGQKSASSAEVYLRKNRRHLAESMDQIQTKIFDEDGNLKADTGSQPQRTARVVHMRAK